MPNFTPNKQHQTKRKSKEGNSASDTYYESYIKEKTSGIKRFCPTVRCNQILIKHAQSRNPASWKKTKISITRDQAKGISL